MSAFRALVAQREATTEEVLASIRKQPFGGLRTELFKWVLSYVHKFLVLRDDGGSVSELRWATYALTREPRTFASYRSPENP